MSQALILAEMILLRALRNKLVLSLLLLSLPAILAAHLFDIANPGFQTLFIKDIGGAFLSFFSILMVLFLALENVFWQDKKQPEWFILSRIRSRLNLFAGQWAGISVTLLAGLICLSSVFMVFMRTTHGLWFWEIFVAAWLIFLESSVLVAMIIFFSTIFSRLISLSLGALTCIISSTAVMQTIKASPVSDASSFLASLFLSVIPDSAMFSVEAILLEQQVIRVQEAMISTFYAAFLIGFYLLAAELISNWKRVD